MYLRPRARILQLWTLTIGQESFGQGSDSWLENMGKYGIIYILILLRVKK